MELRELFYSFQDRWNINVLSQMTLEEYAYNEKNGKRVDFIYWIKDILKDFSDIRYIDSSAFFLYKEQGWYKNSDSKLIGIDNAKILLDNMIKPTILQIIDAVLNDDLEEIDDIGIFWPAIKWKIAFHYQKDFDNTNISPILNDTILERICKNELNITYNKNEFSKFHRALKQKAGNSDFFQYSQELAMFYSKATTSIQSDNTKISSENTSANMQNFSDLTAAQNSQTIAQTDNPTINITFGQDTKALEESIISKSNEALDNKLEISNQTINNIADKVEVFSQTIPENEIINEPQNDSFEVANSDNIFINNTNDIANEASIQNLNQNENQTLQDIASENFINDEILVPNATQEQILQEDIVNISEDDTQKVVVDTTQNAKIDNVTNYQNLAINTPQSTTMINNNEFTKRRVSIVADVISRANQNNLSNKILYGPLGAGKMQKLSEYLKYFSTSTGHNYTFCTFFKEYSYEDFVEKPSVGKLSTEKGVFYNACQKALKLAGFNGTMMDFCNLSKQERYQILKDKPKYAIIIDGINRGDVLKIFGKLIFILKGSKRLGESEEMMITLPLSKEKFGIPSNLHIIGTMNTADNDSQHINVELRNSFYFEEMLPKPEFFEKDVVDGINIKHMIETINNRIEYLYDRNHIIGHYYFMELKEHIENKKMILDNIFRYKIIPLLQEYFNDDFEKIFMILGRGFITKEEIKSSVFDEEFRSSMYCKDTKYKYMVKTEFDYSTFKS